MFATATELAAFLGECAFIGDDAIRAEQLLVYATGEIQRETRQTISAVAGDTIELRGNWDRIVRLPQRPVTAVDSTGIIDESGTTIPLTADIDYRARRNGELIRLTGSAGTLAATPSGTNWGGHYATLQIVYDHGFATIPDDIAALTLALAARGWENPTSVMQESFGDYSVTYARAAGVRLTDADRRELRNWMRRT